MRVTKKMEIDYGHRVPNHKSKCYSPHGHRGVIEATIEGDILRNQGDSEEGMVVDFSKIKEAMMNTIDRELDHAFIIWEKDKFLLSLEKYNFKLCIVPFIPTAEELAKYIYYKLYSEVALLPHYGDRWILKKIRFYETPNSWADYESK